MPELASAQPVNDVLFLAPDPAVGWTHPRNFEFFWNGRNPYCVEFGVTVRTNELGFRDRSWTLESPTRTIRIAVIGDSFIEALQVPLERTATKRLEHALARRFPGAAFETMNFGVSNYSVAQYLMVYDAYVRPFRPDYVVVLAGYLNFNRTTERALSSALQNFYALAIRPSYDLDEQGGLVAVPAEDYHRYVASVQTLLDNDYGEDRTRRVDPISPPSYLGRWFLKTAWTHAPRLLRPAAPVGSELSDVPVNYRILEQLQKRVQRDGGALLFADAFEYLEPYGVPRGSGRLARRNEAFIASLGAHYLDVSPALEAAEPSAQFTCDMHFSDAGNERLAEALYRWFERQVAARQSSGPTL